MARTQFTLRRMFLSISLIAVGFALIIAMCGPAIRGEEEFVQIVDASKMPPPAWDDALLSSFGPVLMVAPGTLIGAGIGAPFNKELAGAIIGTIGAIVILGILIIPRLPL